MELVSLTADWEAAFWQHIKRDLLHYFYFAYDWTTHREKTRITLAVEAQRIHGLLLIYDDRAVQLRGSCDAVSLLLETVDLETVDLTSAPHHRPLVLSRYTPTTRCTHIAVLRIGEGQETPSIHHPISALTSADAEAIAEVLREADPEHWGDRTGGHITEHMNTARFVGVHYDGQLASICGYFPSPWAGVIGVVGTRPRYQNRGYATSLVSYAVTQLLRHNATAIIYVRTDNPPALHVYQRVGFTSYRTYFIMTGHKKEGSAQANAAISFPKPS
jgi:ribosomal protein S18 acetylase RimI-like enzyme